MNPILQPGESTSASGALGHTNDAVLLEMYAMVARRHSAKPCLYHSHCSTCAVASEALSCASESAPVLHQLCDCCKLLCKIRNFIELINKESLTAKTRMLQSQDIVVVINDESQCLVNKHAQYSKACGTYTFTQVASICIFLDQWQRWLNDLICVYAATTFWKASTTK